MTSTEQSQAVIGSEVTGVFPPLEGEGCDVSEAELWKRRTQHSAARQIGLLCWTFFFFFFFFARLFKTDTSIFGTEVILGVKDIGDKKRENE